MKGREYLLGRIVSPCGLNPRLPAGLIRIGGRFAKIDRQGGGTLARASPLLEAERRFFA